MRILVLSNLYPPHYIGGYELRCRDITEALRQRGHTVHVLTSDHTVSTSRSCAEPSYPVIRSLRLHGFFGHPWLGIRDLRQLEAGNNRELIASIESFQPDVVHVWNLGGLSKSLALTLQRLDIPTVYDVSDHWIARSLIGDVWLDWWNRESGSIATQLARAVWTVTGNRSRWHQAAPTNPIHHLQFQRIYFCSRRLRDITSQAGYHVDHGEVIHCPVNTAIYDGVVKPSAEPLKDLLYAGRLSEDKGIFTALRAMLELKNRFNGMLHVYGKGEPAYENMLHDYVRQHALPVEFHSANPEQMPQVYRDHDALVFTSEWEEPFALTPLEAMASGLPVIGTLTGGTAELLSHGHNSLTYAAGNAGELASRILQLASDPQLRTNIAHEGQSLVRSRFNLPVITEKIEAFLQESVTGWQHTTLPHYLAA